MSNLAVLALEIERINKLKWYNINRKNKTETFTFTENLFDVTVIFSKNNFSHTGNIIKSKQIPYVVMTDRFRQKFGDDFSVPDGVTLIEGEKFFLRLLPKILRKLIKLSPDITSVAIDTSNFHLAEKLFYLLNPLFREMVFISEDTDNPLFIKSSEEYGIPSEVKKRNEKINCPIIIKTGTDKISRTKRSAMFDLSATPIEEKCITSADITLDLFFPYKVKNIALAEFLTLNGITPKYKLSTLLSKDIPVPVSQLIKKD